MKAKKINNKTCDFGICDRPAWTAFEFGGGEGQITEIRCFCPIHAASPRFAFARAGARRVPFKIEG